MSRIEPHLWPRAVVADPMCGTGAVSEALARSGYSVVAADALTFPVLHAKARLLLRSEPPFAGTGGYARTIDLLNNLQPEKAFFWREYSSDGRPANGVKPRAYFTGSNAARIDAIRTRIRMWEAEGCLTDQEHSLLLHDLILAVNGVASIAGTYGYFRSSFSRQAVNALTLVMSQPMDHGASHLVLQGCVEDVIDRIQMDACYLDPPYTKRQYAGNYHIPETLAQQDEPTPVGDGGLRDWYGQYSAFCSKRTVADAFMTLTQRVNAQHIFLSYSEDGLIGADDLRDILAQRGSVTRHEYPLPRYVSNSAGRRESVSEYLFHVRVQ